MLQTPLGLCRDLCRRAGHTHRPGTVEELECLAKRLLLVEAAFDQAEEEMRAREARAAFAPGRN